MNILVLGGTGSMGIYLVEILAKAGYQVDVTSRSQRENKDNISYIQGSARNVDFVNRVLSGKRYMAIIDFMIYSTCEFEQRYLTYLCNTDQYFYLSTSRVYANSQKIKETSPRLLDVVSDKKYLNTDEYALAKARQENILNESGRKNYTIIRPYITYSKARLQLGVLDKDTFIYRAIKGRAVVVPKDIMEHTTTLTYGFDVSSCIAQLVGNSKAFGETYNIVSDKSIKWMDVLNIYLNVFEEKKGFRPRVVTVERCPQLNVDNQRYQVIYDRLYDRNFDNSKLIEVIGGFEFTDHAVGLAKCMEAFLDDPEFSELNGMIEGVHDYYSGDYTALNEFLSKKQKVCYSLYRIAPILTTKLRAFIG